MPLAHWRMTNHVNTFLMGKGVEAAAISALQFDVQEQMNLYREGGGRINGCGVCCESEKDDMS